MLVLCCGGVECNVMLSGVVLCGVVWCCGVVLCGVVWFCDVVLWCWLRCGVVVLV